MASRGKSGATSGHGKKKDDDEDKKFLGKIEFKLDYDFTKNQVRYNKKYITML